MTAIFAERALLPNGWARRVRIVVGDDGRIAEIAPNSQEISASPTLKRSCLVPAPSNLHSHSFQRAMAGMAEHRSAGRDDFWSWRELMYRFLERLTPDQIEAIAAMVFVEMQESGYAAVGEFHYVHHQPDGVAYDNIAELSERIFAAAAQTGIGLTHLPVLYTYGGAGQKPLKGSQKRFGCDIDRFNRLCTAARTALRNSTPDCAMGLAIHSLRATDPEQYRILLDRYGGEPIHIHAAEQHREVEEVEQWLGARPVAWLLDNMNVDERWCLVHATQMDVSETQGLARSGAVAGLCPITEANLGDGTFNGRMFLDHEGRIGIGSDSNIRISLSEELRQLEYSQRLYYRARNVMTEDGHSTGQALLLRSTEGAAQAIGRDSGALETGKFADMVAIDTTHLAFCGLTEEQLIDGWVFATDDRVVTDVWSAGRHCVINGQHVQREEIEGRYRHTIRLLADRI